MSVDAMLLMVLKRIKELKMGRGWVFWKEFTYQMPKSRSWVLVLCRRQLMRAISKSGKFKDEYSSSDGNRPRYGIFVVTS